MVEQQVFSNSEENDEEQYPISTPSQCNIRRPTKEEVKRLTIIAVEQAKSKYWLRNRTVNENEGVPRGIFIKDKGVTQGASKNIERKQHKMEQRPDQKEESKELQKETKRD